MTKPRWTRILAVLVACGLPAARPCAVLAQDATVVILVRHAERAPEPRSDPVLSAEGTARAQALAVALADTRLDGIVTTQLQRTRLTAEPIIAARGITPDVVNTAGGTATHVQAVASHVRTRYTGKTVLVVGHSNTIPPIITALGGPRLADLCDTEFAHLYVLVLRADGTASLVDGSFGTPDAPTAADCRHTMPR